MSHDEFAHLLNDAAAAMPRPTEARDLTPPDYDVQVRFDFTTWNVGLPIRLLDGDDGPRCCRTNAIGSRGDLAGCVQRAATKHRQLLEDELARGHVDA